MLKIVLSNLKDAYLIQSHNPISDAHSFIMDSAAMDVRNVGGAAKFTTGKDSSEFRVFSSLKSRGTENIFSHSIGTLNSLSNYPPSLSRKIHTSSSNSMSSLDAVTSSKALLRYESCNCKSLFLIKILNEIFIIDG